MDSPLETLLPSLFYDVIEYDAPSIDKGAKKHMVVFFLIEKRSHVPLLSFCYEDVMDVAPDRIYEQIEMYCPVSISRDGLIISMSIDQYKPYTMGEDKIVHELRKTKFNNYNYIERTIIDQVQEHEYTIPQIINKVKRISEQLNGG